MSEGRAALPRQSDPSRDAECIRALHRAMCLSHPHPRTLLEPPAVRDDDADKAFTATLDAMTRRPTWTLRGVLKQPTSTTRPGLPRRFNTKINLNEYWGVLEKVVKVQVSWPKPAQHPDDASTMDVDNEVNENLANERAEAEQSKMDVDQDDDIAKMCQVPPCSPGKEVNTISSPQKDVIADVCTVSCPQKDVIVEVTKAPVSPRKVEGNQATRKTPSKSKREKGRRRSAPPVACSGSAPATPLQCGALASCGLSPASSPSRRVPLGTINGIESRGHLQKSLSPLSLFADNLARRLTRQH